MTRHLVAPNHSVLCYKSSQEPASRTIHAVSRTIFHRNLPVPDSIRGFASSFMTTAGICINCLIEQGMRFCALPSAGMGALIRHARNIALFLLLSCANLFKQNQLGRPSDGAACHSSGAGTPTNGG